MVNQIKQRYKSYRIPKTETPPPSLRGAKNETPVSISAPGGALFDDSGTIELISVH